MEKNNVNLNNIPLEKLRFADPGRRTGDKKFDTKPMSYAKDVFRRFCKNKSSVVAAIIILLLVLFAIFVPVFCETPYSLALTDTTYLHYRNLLPKSEFLSQYGFWDGAKDKTINENQYNVYRALEVETGADLMVEVYGDMYTEGKTNYYDVRVDSYVANGMQFIDLTYDQFKDLQEWQNETGIQVSSLQLILRQLIKWVDPSSLLPSSLMQTFGMQPQRKASPR